MSMAEGASGAARAGAPAICVVGMHRSGTSCLMGSLEEAGLFAGEVVRAAPHNAKGNRENLEIRALNDDVLSHCGGRWDVPPLSVRWSAQHAERRRVLVAAFAARDRPWGFKDPRTLLTLAFWKDELPDLRLVGTFRHPLAVARSLITRDGMPMEKGIRLWEHYNLILLDEWHRRPFPLICFDEEAHAYQHALRALVGGLGLPPAEPTALPRFFSPDLRHQNHLATAPPEVPASASGIYRRLLEIARPR